MRGPLNHPFPGRIAMRTPSLCLPLLALAALSCQSSSSFRTVEADEALRQPLFDAVASLEGRWEGEGPEGTTLVSEFHVSSAGSAVVEVMSPGSPHEMTNMYTLDGNSLLMTHYCASGNQPHMRARAFENGKLAFDADGVSDLNPDEEGFMGAMTLVLVDANTLEQHWVSMNPAGEPDLEHSFVFELKRVN